MHCAPLLPSDSGLINWTAASTGGLNFAFCELDKIKKSSMKTMGFTDSSLFAHFIWRGVLWNI